MADPAAQSILLIPDGLQEFDSSRTVMRYGQAGVFHKLLKRSAFGTEFFSNAPCLAYVLRGVETFHDADGCETVVKPGDTLLVPRHHHMVSEFSSKTGPLEAWLFFFDQRVIADFLKATSHQSVSPLGSKTALFAGTPCLRAYVDALPRVYDGLQAPAALVRAKLLEVLMLLHLNDERRQVHGFLVNENAGRARRNIKQVMRAHALADLTVADYAKLSGRSVSAFQRDFKRQFGEPPSAWLRRARLEHAHDMVMNTGNSIAQIACAAGYADTSHFIKAYKELFQKTPKQQRLALA